MLNSGTELISKKKRARKISSQQLSIDKKLNKVLQIIIIMATKAFNLKEFITKHRYLYGNTIMVCCFLSCYVQNNKLLEEGNTNLENVILLKQIKATICKTLAQETTISSIKNQNAMDVKIIIQTIIKDSEDKSGIVLSEDNDEVEDANNHGKKDSLAVENELTLSSVVNIFREYFVDKKK